jgi:hypothetical protein
VNGLDAAAPDVRVDFSSIVGGALGSLLLLLLLLVMVLSSVSARLAVRRPGFSALLGWSFGFLLAPTALVLTPEDSEGVPGGTKRGNEREDQPPVAETEATAGVSDSIQHVFRLSSVCLPVASCRRLASALCLFSLLSSSGGDVVRGDAREEFPRGRPLPSSPAPGPCRRVDRPEAALVSHHGRRWRCSLDCSRSSDRRWWREAAPH